MTTLITKIRRRPLKTLRAQINIPYEYRCKILFKRLVNSMQQHLKMMINLTESNSSQEYSVCLTSENQLVQYT